MEREKGAKTILSPSAYDAVILDLDGVVTRTAAVHAAAWKQLFDDFLSSRKPQGEENLEPFRIDPDYYRYVDGKPRYDGVKSFLKSRNIQIPFGSPDDPPGKETICGLGNRKNQFFRQRLQENGVEVYESTIELLRDLRSHGLQTAVVSSSKNCAHVLQAADAERWFDTRVDGTHSEQMGLEGKPAPDIFLEAARRLEVDPGRAVVVEDALAGVEAGRRGEFGLVIGVDRGDNAGAYLEAGADVVVSDLSRVAVEEPEIPSALEQLGKIQKRCEGKRIAVFLDYDGTLTPIVRRPEMAVLSGAMREVLMELARFCKVAVISGRDLEDVRSLVGLEGLFYAGSHGFDIQGPEGYQVESQKGTEHLPALEEAEKMLQKRLQDIEGAWVERKKFSVAVHFRETPEGRVEEVRGAVEEVQTEQPGLRLSSGKKIFELQPDVDWDKGKALLWLMDALDLDPEQVVPFYLGDDTTDEDAFRVLKKLGIGIVVQESRRPTAALYRVRDTHEVREFLSALVPIARGERL
jgi:alpha,alpha-trehalase